MITFFIIFIYLVTGVILLTLLRKFSWISLGIGTFCLAIAMLNTYIYLL